MAEHTITSAANPRLKALVGLRRRRRREESGRTLLEGYDEFALALDAGVRPRELYICDDLMADPSTQHDVVRAARETGAEIVRLSRAAFEKVAYREGADGFLAVVPAVGAMRRIVSMPESPTQSFCSETVRPGYGAWMTVLLPS